MIYYKIPVNSNYPAYSFSTILDAKTYFFTLEHNLRSDRWSMDITDSQGTILVTGVLLNYGIDLIERYALDNAPSGHLFIYDTEGKSEDPTRYTLGTRFELIYAVENES